MWSEKRILSDGFQGISHGTVFIFKVQDVFVKSGRNDVIGVSHLPSDLENEVVK